MGDECDACGREVPVAGGIGNLWTLEKTETGGLLLELADGTDHFLCFECIEDLPEDREPTAEDVAGLKRSRENGDDG
jgi:hypothetical protein